MTLVSLIAAAGLSLGAAVTSLHAQERFEAGPVIPAFGKIAKVETDLVIPDDTEFRVVFDIADSKGGLNRSLVTPARFLNMHAAAGVPVENLNIALVVHGRATKDLVKPEDGENPNAPLIAALIEQGAKVYVCGQSAAAHGVTKASLLPGVEMALSAMTANALLLQQGYTLNPF